jgi:hypothetical protein
MTERQPLEEDWREGSFVGEGLPTTEIDLGDLDQAHQLLSVEELARSNRAAEELHTSLIQGNHDTFTNILAPDELEPPLPTVQPLDYPGIF